ncbi:MAG: dTMP kinase [Nitrososphaerota archaeon]|nr:dTMP kinase [Nitrososphaerota archaeon]
MKDKNSGYLISFEGIDASGKNTQSRLLFEYLRSKDIDSEYISFPDYITRIGNEIHDFLSRKTDYNLETRHLLYAANRYEHKEKLQKWIEEGKVVVINRYSESNYAYGAANGLPLDWLVQIESRMPRADYIISLKISPEISMQRKAVRDRYEGDLAFLQRVSDVYDALVEKGRWFAIDGARPKEEVHYEISQLVAALLEESSNNNQQILTSVGQNKNASKIRSREGASV